MSTEHKVVVVVPAFNEEKSIGKVISTIPKNLVSSVIVTNNNSSDNTANIASEAGAIVLDEERRGYGWACLKGIRKAKELGATIIVFIDGDFSDYPEQLPRVLDPILNDEADMVIGSRTLGKKEKGSLTPQQLFGNWLATRLMRLFYGINYTDLGPFRAIKVEVLDKLNMQDKTYGWTIEMQIKAAQNKLRSVEVPVDYRKRIGVSKVSGTIKGSIMAGYKIITAIFKYKFH
ncbi:MAG: glycosyltransferase family 2 protein [Crocinitomicaceae bacterium]